MASHLLTVAKATFAASLLRPDITKVNRDEVPHFHTLIDTAMLQCTPANIQTCKQWLMTHIVPSSTRSTAFLKYVVVLSRQGQPAQNAPKKTTIRRQRLHLLYLLHDVLHETKYHVQGSALLGNTTQACQTSIVELFRLATAESRSKTQQRLQELIDLWEADKYFSKDCLNQLRQTVANPAEADGSNVATTEPTSTMREVPYMMPASHGDPTLPFYELPAGNLMPHIHPNKTIPMQPDSIRPLQFSAGPADESLVHAVKDFLKDVADIDNTFAKLDEEGIVPEIDELGQISYRNDAGDLVGDTYYGWSRSFCEKMKVRRKGPPQTDTRHGRGRSRSWSSRSRSSSRNLSRSRSPRKRQRYGSRSRSSSRGEHIPRGGLGAQTSRQQPNPRSSSPRPQIGFRNSSNETSNPTGNRQGPSHFPPPPPPPLSGMDPHFAHLPPPPFGPDGLPVPPPRPPNWSGPWPPPPPLPPGQPGFDARRGFPASGGGRGR